MFSVKLLESQMLLQQQKHNGIDRSREIAKFHYLILTLESEGNRIVVYIGRQSFSSMYI